MTPGELALVVTLALCIGAVAMASPAEAQLTQEEERENWQAALGDIAWLLWLAGFGLTRLARRVPPVLILCDLVLASLVFFPMEPAMRAAVVGATGILVLVDCLSWAGVLPWKWT